VGMAAPSQLELAGFRSLLLRVGDAQQRLDLVVSFDPSPRVDSSVRAGSNARANVTPALCGWPGEPLW
jgi:hypothetical protein